MNNPTILTCVQDAGVAERLRWIAGENRATLREEAGFGSAILSLASDRTDVIVAEWPSFGPASVSFLEAARRASPSTPVIAVIERPSLADAARCVRSGFLACLTPDSETPEFHDAIDAGIAQSSCHRPHTDASEPWRKNLIGRSMPIENVCRIVRLIAPRRCTVLITGETGTGKEVVARAIHEASDRSRHPFVAINCGAIPENLIEAELFGHVKGAFTGAAGSRMGRFEQAGGGTIFLDEIGELPFDLQAKLLRVLQEREIQRIGGGETVKVNVRVVAATNADLLAKVRKGEFREDLYYRLDVVPIRIPALRDRASDIPFLVSHFIGKICRGEGLPLKTVSPEAFSRLCAYSWPGNVRQLENAVEQAVVMAGDRGSLNPCDFCLPRSAQSEIEIRLPAAEQNLPDEGMDFSLVLRTFERSILEQAMRKSRGNKTLAADMLRIPRTTLIHKLRAIDMVA